MNFLNPLGLLGLIGIPIIIIIYLIRSRYKEKTVSSTFIWKRSLKYSKRRIPLNFILSLLLLLQILTITVGSLAVARPMFTPWSTDEVIIVIDSSASMLTKDDNGRTRFDLAKEEAKVLAEKADTNKRVSVISAGEHAESIIMRSDNKFDVIEAIEQMTCNTSSSDVDGAITLIENIKKENMEAKVYLFTDRDYKSNGVEVKNIARAEDWNVSIVSVEDAVIAGSYSFTAEVISYGKDTEVIVALYVDGRFIHSKEISLLDSESKRVSFAAGKMTEQDGVEYTIIEAIDSYDEAQIRISFKGGVDDGLSFDNQYHLYSTNSNQPKVMYVSNYVKIMDDGSVDGTMETRLITMLRIYGFRVTLNDMYSPETYKNAPKNESGDVVGYDLYIFEGYLPDKFPEDGAIWVINPTTSSPSALGTLGISVSDVIHAEDKIYGQQLGYGVASSDSEIYGDLIRNVDAQNIYVLEYRTIFYDADSEYVPIFTDGDRPVVVAGKSGTQRIVVISFNLYDSNWPILLKDFPMFVVNISDYSNPDYLDKRVYNVGDEAIFSTPAGAKSYRIIFNDLYGVYAKNNGSGIQHVLFEYETAQDITLRLENVGVYEIEVTYEDGSIRKFRLPTYLTASETDVTNSTNAITELREIEIPADAGLGREPVELWPYLIILLLVLLVVEWGVYYRDEF